MQFYLLIKGLYPTFQRSISLACWLLVWSLELTPECSVSFHPFTGVIL